MKNQNIILAALVLLGGYLLYAVFASFFIPLCWAAVMAIVFYPYYIWLIAATGLSRSMAAFIACATIGVFVVVPMFFLGSAIATEVLGLYQWAEEHIRLVSSQAANKSVVFLPSSIAGLIRRYAGLSDAQINNIFAATLKEASYWLVGGMTDLVKSFVQIVVNAVLAFFAMFYIFRDGWRFLATTMRLIPLSVHDREKLVDRTGKVIQATVIGGLFVGVVQGLLGGLAFWAVGLNAPILWGFVMFLLSFLPWIGTALVWFPAAVYLLLTGDHFSGFGLMIWGFFVVGLIDNFLRPLLISEAADLHPLLVFFSIIGAVNAFGIIGIIAGPLILSIAVAAIEIYQENNHP